MGYFSNLTVSASFLGFVSFEVDEATRPGVGSSSPSPSSPPPPSESLDEVELPSSSEESELDDDDGGVGPFLGLSPLFLPAFSLLDPA